MNSARILRMAPFRAAAMRPPVVRQAFQRQARPFHNTRTMLRTKVRSPQGGAYRDANYTQEEEHSGKREREQSRDMI